MAVVVVLALLAVGAVFYLRSSDEGGADAAPVQTRPAVYRIVDTGRMNDVLASREVDSLPLNEGELFERNNTEISSQSIDFTLRDADLTDDCSSAVWGQELTQAVADADCTQVGRATYVSDTYFGVTAVFNLADVDASRQLAAAMSDPEEETGEDTAAARGFVLAPSGAAPFDRLGEGYSASDAIISGHYLVVVWVQSTDSESVEDRVSLAGPLVALANFRDPLYRRMVQLDDGSDEGTGGTGQTDGTGQTGTEGGGAGRTDTGQTGGTGQTGTGTTATTDPDGITGTD
ncbi:hypothetical protein [Nocardiopsis sp. FIRDI 009]|uniref:hypothetical protein n=1 Tax=Nocardiopsis sp. FIRDI 009 TaxID=714197 RepID=UPI0018E547A4